MYINPLYFTIVVPETRSKIINKSVINLISNFLNILILLGTFQGVITATLLYRLKPRGQANTILALFTLLISLACLNIYFLLAVKSLNPFLRVFGEIIPLIILMPIGPLVYFYVKALLYPEFKLSKKNRPHFYSIIIDLIPYLASTILLLGNYFDFVTINYNEQWKIFVDTYFIYSDIPRWISLAIYLWLTYKMLNNYEASKKEYNTFRWAKRFTSGMSLFTLIWLFHLVPYVIPSLSDELLALVGWYPIYMPLVVLIYWIGISGFIMGLKSNQSISKKLSPAEIKNVMDGLDKAMKKDKLYLNPTLKLNDIVKHIEVPQKTISAVLNQHSQKTFKEFINGYRIEEFKLRLLKNNSEKLTLIGVAFECGFNSEATFHRVFKKSVHLSPKEFLQKHSINRVK